MYNFALSCTSNVEVFLHRNRDLLKIFGKIFEIFVIKSSELTVKLANTM